MTDMRNDLIIRTDAGDTINLDDNPDAWVKDSATKYHSTADSDITVEFTGSGTIVDGIIQGLEYTTMSGLTGFTEADGSFDYIEGDIVTFKLGSVIIGSMDMSEVGDDKVFLQDIAGVDRTDMNDEYLENLAVLLQSIDSDSGDNIVITEEMRDVFADEDMDLATISEEDLASNLEEKGIEAVSEEEAMAHVGDMLVAYDGVEEGTLEEHVDDDAVDMALIGDEVIVSDDDSNSEASFDWIFDGDKGGSVTEIENSGTIRDSGEVNYKDSDGNSMGFISGECEAGDGTLGSLTIDENGNWEYSVDNDQISYLNDGESKEETFTIKTEDGSTMEILVIVEGADRDTTTVEDTQSEELNDILPAEESKSDESDDRSDSESESTESSSDSVDDGSYADPTVGVTVDDQPVAI